MNTLTEKAINLECLIRCLSAIDTDNTLALQDLPEALKTVSDKMSELVNDIENFEALKTFEEKMSEVVEDMLDKGYNIKVTEKPEQ